jgi:hypothetical protein
MFLKTATLHSCASSKCTTTFFFFFKKKKMIMQPCVQCIPLENDPRDGYGGKVKSEHFKRVVVRVLESISRWRLETTSNIPPPLLHTLFNIPG